MDIPCGFLLTLLIGEERVDPNVAFYCVCIGHRLNHSFCLDAIINIIIIIIIIVIIIIIIIIIFIVSMLFFSIILLSMELFLLLY